MAIVLQVVLEHDRFGKPLRALRSRSPFGSGSCLNATRAYVAEKTPLTNHIGRQFARIKAPRSVSSRISLGKKARFHNASRARASRQRNNLQDT
ncbi:MAG TPA: hypothetical protein VMM15_22235, partial [Bradyrhizobium sp.]|nr:hypothetical protein [Bradyrhizobium sp.]